MRTPNWTRDPVGWIEWFAGLGTACLKDAGRFDECTGFWAIVGAVVPFPFIARVQATACNRMSNQLRSFFSGTDGQTAGTQLRRRFACALHTSSLPSPSRRLRLRVVPPRVAPAVVVAAVACPAAAAAAAECPAVAAVCPG